MVRLYIWGTGKLMDLVFSSLKFSQCQLLGFIDSDDKKQGKMLKERYIVYSPQSIIEFDYIIISAQYRSKSILACCQKLGIPNEKVIDFWNDELEYPFLDSNYKKVYILEKEVEKYKCRLENAPYELGVKQVPIVKSGIELLEHILKNKNSLCRFGDGEFEMIRGNERLWYQKPSKKLAKRLREVLDFEEKKVEIAIADDFGNLDKYKEDIADGIRGYLCHGTRTAIVDMLKSNKEYWDAYVSRPYIIYRDAKNAEIIFKLFKEILYNRELYIVEGKYTRMGVGNDLFNGCKQVKRIICPDENSFDKYEVILNESKKYIDKDALVLISLGPTATVLAYDLAMCGIQALDIGQIDNEYEWYLKGVSERTEIAGKSVAELNWCHKPGETKDALYESQIIARIL